ncbi:MULTISPECIES: hypothetical protein [unclassified Pseudomonas]|uniref:hypothetical protein n=1 Tax=unclassified Pseudomonas TaxID=196821 RepID=UPI000CD396D1|nr:MULTISPECIES: hypothetical protein [unclassified Pseudomonas]POA28189.1 hypothetical protein C1887_24895 [Pseudomonas sp. GW456-R21]POA62148.1 hypothetical protein C1884_27590 [Pseudomonas sp. GW460-R15]
MQINMGKPFKHQALAKEMASEALKDNQAAFEQMENNWSIARASKDITIALAARGGVFESLAAAAILGKSSDLEKGARFVIKWGCELAQFFRPAPELLLVELSLAIGLGDHNARRQLAQAILKHAPSDDFYSLERAQAQTLAALVDLDYDVATRHANRLLEASQSGEFNKAESLLAASWAKVFRNLALQNFQGCFEALVISHAEFSRQVDQDLGRLQRGRETDVMVFDMVDWSANAVDRLLRDFGYKLDARQKFDSAQGPDF